MEKKEFKLIKPGEIRTRFAPSPTGFLHIGNARTFLFNFLFTRNQNGRIVLRIEDTDKERSKKEHEENIIELLKWLNIEWDEGPDIGGDYGPYRQSERTEIYTKYLEKLLKEGSAYYCFCSKDDLEAEKQYLMSIGKPPIYSGKCKELSKETVNKYLKEGSDSIIRFKSPFKKIIFKDLVRGKIEFDSNVIGDFSLAKNLKEPLYNFSCAIDDFEMKISHVIRGDDHIANTPKQILIQQALDFPTPKYAHLPMILADDKSKLSKRKHGNIASVENFKEKGYLPETMVNFLAFLGWNPGTEREIFSMNSLIKEFGLDRVKKGGAIFNVKRLDYLNGFYIRKKSLEKLTQECIPYLIEAEFVEPVFKDQERMPDFIGQFGKEIVLKFIIKQTKQEVSFDYIQKIVSIYQERLKKLEEIIELTEFFFKQELEYSKELLKWKDQSDEELGIVLNKLERKLSDIKYNNWNKQTIENTLIGQENSVGSILWPFRTALTGKKASAGPFDIAEILGKDKALERIRNAKKLI